jgi:hypothetical protein
VLQVLGQDLAQVALVEDEQPAGDFAAQGTDHPLADRIASYRQLHLIRVIGTDASG